MRYDDALKIIGDHYGFSSQADMLCEEAAEFTVALNKLRRGKAEAYANIKEELADVSNESGRSRKVNRLTDQRTAEALKHNAAGLKAKGFDVPIDDLRYIKLAKYEDEEERKEKALVNYDPDEWYE